jgi:hypothetical protein
MYDLQFSRYDSAAVNAFSFSIEKKRVHVFLKGECACIISIGYTHLHAHSSFKKMMQGT